MVWATVILSAGVGACVLPAPGDELGPLDNRPPRIEPTNLQPSPVVGVVRVEPPDCRVEFSASVSDPDVDDLFYRVFVDRPVKPSSAELPVPGTVFLNPTDRRALIQFQVEAGYVGPNPHTVELLVADREFSTGRDEASISGRNLVDPEGLTATFMWPVVLEDICAELAQ